MAYVSRFLYLGTFSLSVFSYLLPLLCHFTTFLFRLRKGDGSLETRFDFSETEHTSEEFNDAVEVMDHMNEENATDFSFGFRFPTYEEFIKFKGNFGLGDLVPETCFDGFIEETEVVDTNVKDVESGRESGKAENKSQNDFDFSNDVLFQSDKDSLVTDSDSASIGFEHMHSLMSRLRDSYSDGFLSDDDFVGDFKIDSFKDLVGDNLIFHHPEIPDKNQDSGHFDGNEELRELEQDHICNMESMASEFLSENDFHEVHGTPELKNAGVLDSGDTNKWEHQDLIEQLKAELRKVRTSSLPTILEESESPEMEDLKPWKNVDQSFQPEDCMVELQQFYKAYRERMRRFDILTYQKMYAIGFLQKEPLKDPLQLLSSQKSSGLTLKSLLSQNIWLFKQKSREVDPMANFIKELRSDLEVVYVGQMCLSWEFLHWQYIKALDLWDSDPRGIHRYNEVSEEFQQFMVLMLRFIEDEPFQGTRVQHYIKCRCDFRSLLQVPLIKDDSLKEKKKARNFEKGGDSITSDMLVEIMEECIRIFWRFVKADKESSGVVGKGHKRVHPVVRNAEDIGLLREVTKSLHKKERKLKETLKSENSILRSFRRCREEDIDHHVLYFFSQVDMKLVSRVLNMSAITRDQLLWCHNKLSRISFQHKKIHVEPSFLLFPCSY